MSSHYILKKKPEKVSYTPSNVKEFLHEYKSFYKIILNKYHIKN